MNTLLTSSLSPISPISPIFTPHSPLRGTVYSPVGTVNATHIPIVNNVAIVTPSQIDSGLHDNPMAQVQIIDYIHYKFLDKWLFDDFSKLLKYLKVSNNRVNVVKNKNEYKSNDVTNDSKKTNEQKADFIEDEILDKKSTKQILIKLINENSIKWYELPHNETLVKHAIKQYVKKELKKKLGN
jgi:hypothetical protein